MSLQAPPPPPPINQPRGSRRGRIAIIFALVLLVPMVSLAVLAGLALQTGEWRSFNMSSGSMEPTLLLGDFLLVDKLAYVGGSRPGRGDIIAFYLPPEARAIPQVDPSAVYIKRVIGLPGDHIVLKQGIPVINGTEAVQTKVGIFRSDGPPGSTPTQLHEKLTDGTSYDIVKYESDAPLDSGDFEVPAGAYFVLGDNRDNSVDSRIQLGAPGRHVSWYVPLNDIIGRANYIYWSGFGRLGRIGQALK